VIPEAVEALHEAVAASRVVLTFPGIGGAVDWSPDGRLFATEGPEESGLIDVRDARTGAPVLSVPGHEIDVNAVAFSPDGSMLATTGDDGALRIWDPESGDRLASFRFGREGEVWGVSFSPDGRRVAASYAATVRVFDLASERVVAELPGLGAYSTSFSADGRRLAVGNDYGGPASVFDISTGQLAFTVGEVGGWVRALAFSPDGRWLATIGDTVTRLWRADTGEAAVSITGHTGYVSALAWSSDGTRLATVSRDGTARVSDLVDGRVEASLALSADDTGGGLHGVDFSPNGQRLLTGDIDLNAVKIWDVSVAGGAEWGNLSDVPPFPAGATLTPDGAGVVVADPDGGVAVWDAETGIRRREIGVRSPGAVNVTDFAMTEDGELLALVWDQRRVEIWDTREGERLVVLQGEITGGDVADVAWTHEDHRLAVGTTEGDEQWVSVVDAGGTELAHLTEDEVVDDIAHLTFSADDRLLANTRLIRREVATGMGARIWDWEAEETVRFIPTPSLVAEFAPRGDRLVTIRRGEGRAEVWDAGSGERLASMAAPSLFNGVTYSPDGAQIATAGGDGVVRLWDAETGEQKLALRGHLAAVLVVDFSPDGSRLVSVSDPDNVARVWALDLDDLIELASRHVTGSLTEAECRQYLHVETCPEA
jgi:WD40 repeat protein